MVAAAGRPAPGAGRVEPAGSPGCAPAGRRADRERGTVTAELALVLPAVVLVLLVVLAAAAGAVTQVRCADAARAGARAAALGEAPATIGAVVRDLAGADADVSVRTEDGWVVVEVARPVAGLGWDGWQARATARAWPEPEG